MHDGPAEEIEEIPGRRARVDPGRRALGRQASGDTVREARQALEVDTLEDAVAVSRVPQGVQDRAVDRLATLRVALEPRGVQGAAESRDRVRGGS